MTCRKGSIENPSLSASPCNPNHLISVGSPRTGQSSRRLVSRRCPIAIRSDSIPSLGQPPSFLSLNAVLTSSLAVNGQQLCGQSLLDQLLHYRHIHDSLLESLNRRSRDKRAVFKGLPRVNRDRTRLCDALFYLRHRVTNVPGSKSFISWTQTGLLCRRRQQVTGGEHVRCQLIQLEVGMTAGNRNHPVIFTRRRHILHQDAAFRGGGGRRVRNGRTLVRSTARKGFVGRGIRIRILAHSVPGSARGLLRSVPEVLPHHIPLRVVPRRQVNLDGGRSIFPLHRVHADGQPGGGGRSLRDGLDNFSGEDGIPGQYRTVD